MSAPSMQFVPADLSHQAPIFEWLDKPHVKEFWDNSQAHRDDIILFINGRKEPSIYFEGIFSYWVALIKNEPYALLMTSLFHDKEDLPLLFRQYLSETGRTYGIDFMIGNEKYLGKGLGAPTLEAFTHFFQSEIDNKADRFFIDPNLNNPRATHVYEKAGFNFVGSFTMSKGFFEGQGSHLMIKQLPVKT